MVNYLYYFKEFLLKSAKKAKLETYLLWYDK